MLRTLRITALMAFAGLALASAPEAKAVFVGPGNQALADLGTPTLIGGTSLATATGFNLTGSSVFTAGSRDGGFLAGAAGVSANPIASFIPSTPLSFSFGNAFFGVFTGISDTLVASSAVSRDFQIVGIFTPGTEFGGGPAFQATVALGFTQNGGPGSAISDSFTLTVGSAVPEPASIAMLGLGLAGLAGFSARRRRSAV